MLYSGHLSIADTSLRNQLSPVMVKPLYFEPLYSQHHSIADTFFENQWCPQLRGFTVVFTTKEEKDESEKIENQPVQEIKRLTFEMIDELKYKDFLTDMYRKFAKGKDKAAHLEFYHDVADIWHDQDRINTRDDDIEIDS